MKNILLTALAIMMSMAVSLKTADAASFTLGYSNTFGSGSFGTVDIIDQGTTLGFSVKADQSFFGSGLVWDKFYFNSGLNNVTLSTAASANWSLNSINHSASMFGKFSYEAKGKFLSDSIGDPLEFKLEKSGTDLSIGDVTLLNNKGWMFAGHLKGFDKIQGQTSTHVASPVPEPTTMLLFGTGLAGLVGIGLRRKKK